MTITHQCVLFGADPAADPADFSGAASALALIPIPHCLDEILPDPLLLTPDSDFKIYRRPGRRVIPTRMP
ncbi:hypothetical protein HQ447_09975 [bacterium]|nr:hypothetical protein [bacterium]